MHAYPPTHTHAPLNADGDREPRGREEEHVEEGRAKRVVDEDDRLDDRVAPGVERVRLQERSGDPDRAEEKVTDRQRHQTCSERET